MSEHSASSDRETARGHTVTRTTSALGPKRTRQRIWITVTLLALLAIAFYVAEVLFIVLDVGHHQ